jgi:hypothetical protein
MLSLGRTLCMLFAKCHELDVASPHHSFTRTQERSENHLAGVSSQAHGAAPERRLMELHMEALFG